MKLFFNILRATILCSPILCQAGIIVITYSHKDKLAYLAKKSLIKYSSIPSKLIAVQWQNKPCQKVRGSILQICIENDGEMKFPIINQRVMNNSFQIFKRKSQEEYR